MALFPVQERQLLSEHDRILLVLVSCAVSHRYLAVVWNVDSVVWVFPLLLRLVRLQILCVSSQVYPVLARSRCLFSHHFEELRISVGDLAHIEFSRSWQGAGEPVGLHPRYCVAVMMLAVPRVSDVVRILCVFLVVEVIVDFYCWL